MKPKTVKLISGILFFFTLLLFRLSLVPALAQVTATDFVVVEQRADKLSRITPNGARTAIYSFASGTWPSTVTIDSNGDFIVAETFAHKLSRVTPAGVRTVIYSFVPGTFPDQVAIDGNGDFIVAEVSTNQLSRITPAGVRTVIFSFPSGTTPAGVAIDSNGDFIVSEHGTSKLVRITPGGARTVIFSFPGVQPGLHFIAIDSSGNFIVPAAFTNKLYRVTPAGVGAEVFSFPAGTYATGVAIDSNGDYIIPGLFADKLYRITPSGVGTVIFNFAAGTGPTGVAVLAPQCVEPPSGLVSWWPGDGNANDIIDGNHGTLQNGVTFVPGSVGQAFGFDGVDDDVIVAHNPNLNLAEFTLDAWIKADPDVSRHRPIVAKEDDLSSTPWFNRNYWFGLNLSGGQLSLYISSGHVIQGISGPALNDGQLHHVAATRAADGSAKLYVDGALVASGSFGVPDFPGSPLHIGRWGINSAGVATGGSTDRSSFKGLIDEVEIYNRALSAQEIQTIFNAGSVGMCKAQSCVEPPTGLVSWWPGDGNANDIQDGNNGTLVNGAIFAAGKVEQAFRFDGVNDEVKVPYAANLNPTQALTLNAWVNINSLTNAANGGYQGVVSMSEGQRAYSFGITGTGSNYLGTAGNVHLEGSGLGSAYRTSAAVITPGQWYHIAGVIEPSTNRFEIYVNGVLQPVVGSQGGPQLASVSNVPFRIGFSDPGFPYHFNGLIDEVEIYNRALSAQEIQTIFNAGSVGMCKEPADTTPPVITANVNGTLGNNGWYRSDVTVSWTVEDQESAITVTSGCGPTTISSDTAGTTLTCTATSAGGTASQSVTVKRDATPPAVIATRSPGANPNGWNNGDVVVAATGSDSMSGIQSCASITLTSESAGQTATVSCTDKAGNSASVTMSGINIDKTAPVTTATLSPTPNGNGWNNTNVSVTLAATDNLSGVAKTEYNLDSAGWVTYSGPTSISTEGSHTLLFRSLDKADNLESARSLTIRIDKTPPEMAARCAPPGGSPFLTGRDGSSGMASVLLTGSSAIRRGELKRQETYTILDKAGNRLEASFGVKAEGHETEFTLLSLAYNGGAQLTLPENELKCEWATEKTGVLKELEQKLEIGRAKSEVEAQAKFEGKKNETEIKVKTHGPGPDLRVTRPGLVFLNLTTNQGALGVDY